MADQRSVFFKPDAKPFRLSRGEHVPRVRGVALVEAMQGNLREATALLREAEAKVRTFQSTGDIYEDADAPRGTRVYLAKDDGAKIAISDVQRAAAEVSHWTEYLGWARGEAAKVAPDSRLPVEREPGSDDGDEAVL